MLVIIAADVSVPNEKAGVRVFSLGVDWTFFFRLPDILSSFYADYIAMFLAFKKLHSSTQQATELTHYFSACTAFGFVPEKSPLCRVLDIYCLNLRKICFL